MSQCIEKFKQFIFSRYAIITGTLLLCVGLITYLTIIMAEEHGNEMAGFTGSEFAVKLYDVLKKTEGNMFFSPYSLQVALAMVYSGASGNTATELQKSLGFSTDKEATYKAVKSSAAELKTSKSVALNMANGIFVQKDYHIKDAFSKNMKKVFEAESKSLNFGDSAGSAKEINGFVNKQTKGKITELFEASAFNEMTKLVLVNAIYFKGAWMNQFDRESTYKDDFHLNNSNKVQVDFMRITKKYNVVEDNSLKSTIIELPYEGEFSMVLIVPKEIEGIKHVENNFHKCNLSNLLRDSHMREVNLSMPKFKLEQKLELETPLKELGIKDMFDSTKADFGGISDGKELYVSKVVQKAYIEVNEEGSEAAAATGLGIMTCCLDMTPPLDLKIDRPFVLFLQHHSGRPLFVGRVSKVSV